MQFEEKYGKKRKFSELRHMQYAEQEEEDGNAFNLPIPRVEYLAELRRDPRRQYHKVFTHFNEKELHALAELLKKYILRPRQRTPWKFRRCGSVQFHRRSRPPKYDHVHRLYLTLHWLVNGYAFKQMEFYYGWSKSVIQEDIRHVLCAINDGLNDVIVWPDSQKREQLASSHTGLFRGCVGIIDGTEHFVQRPKSLYKEHRFFSGKKKRHTMSMMAVIDRYGYFTYVTAGHPGRMNDREIWNASPLYLNAGALQSDWSVSI